MPHFFLPTLGPSRRPLRVALTFLACLLATTSLAVANGLDHDEHQFIASGALLAREGLLPYRDFPYFHVPNLVFVYAALDRLSHHLLLSARLFNALCSAATLTILSTLARRWFAANGPRAAALAAVTVPLAALACPIYAFTTGRAWNHDLPVLLTVLALCAAWRWRRSSGSFLWPAAAGVLVGLAAGTRLTFLPLAAPFVLAFALSSGHSRRAAIASFTAAFALSLLPCWWLLATSPREFLFGNFGYPLLNTAYRRAEGFAKAMTPAGKATFLVTDILTQPAHLLLLVALITTTLDLGRDRLWRSHPLRFELLTLAGTSVVLFAGAFAATPLWLPYFFAPLPFALLWVAAATSSQPANVGRKFLLAGVIACAAGVAPRYLLDFRTLTHPTAWLPNRLHDAGTRLAADTGLPHARVLTFSPIAPLEGGCRIYPEFATGAFAPRVAPLLPDPADRRALHEIEPDDVPDLLARRPADAVLLGTEDRQLEAPVLSFVERHHFTRPALPFDPTLALKTHATLWIAPPPEAPLVHLDVSPPHQ